MKLGDLTITFGDRILDTKFLPEMILIHMRILDAPRITIKGTYQGESIQLDDAYEFSIRYHNVEWEGSLSLLTRQLPSNGSSITLQGILLPPNVALESGNRYYRSIMEGVSSLCSGVSYPSHLRSKFAYYNQTGEMNYQYALQLALRNSQYQIPSLTYTGMRMVDFMHGGEKSYDLIPLTSITTESPNRSYQTDQWVPDRLENYDVTTKSGQFYGMVGKGKTRSIVSRDYIDDYNVLSVNKRLLEDSAIFGSVSISTFVEALPGDNIRYRFNGREIKDYVIADAQWSINYESVITNYGVIDHESIQHRSR